MNMKFRKNESFYIRDGWFQKVMYAIDTYSLEEIFSSQTGTIILGIGSAMVKSLKYYLLAANILENNRKKLQISSFGQLIKDYDPFLEHDFTWYLIHLFLVMNKEECPVYNLCFNSDIKNFNKQQLVSLVLNNVEDKDNEIMIKNVEKDTNIFLKSYINEDDDLNPEENYLSPLSNLKLLRKNNGLYEKTTRNMEHLSSLIIYYNLLIIYKDEESFTINDSLEKENSPYYIFNLDKSAYIKYLDLLQQGGYITINRTAGLNTVYFEKKLSLDDIFRKYFGDKYVC